MDIENQEVEEEEIPEKKPVNKKAIIKKIVTITILIVVLGAISFSGYLYLKNYNSSDKFSKRDYSHVILPENVLRFSFTQFPEVYKGLNIIEDEIILIDIEIERISEIEKAFPDQSKITKKEKKIYDKVRKKLKSSLQKMEKLIESFYVAYKVNEETGSKLIEAKKKDLVKLINSSIESSDKLTKKIKDKNADRGFFDKIKDMF